MMNKNTIKVRELLKQEIDIDVYDDYTEELGIAFCGPMKLTKEGQEYFKDVLDYDIIVYTNNDLQEAVVQVGDYDDAEDRFDKACELFNSMAGYCSDTNYNKWFKEV